MNDDNHRLTIEANLDCLSIIRQFVRSHAEALGIHPDVTADVVLAVDEAATNIIVHGYKKRGGVIDIDIEQDTRGLVVVLRDDAPPFDPTTVSPPDLSLPLDKRPMGGMGVFLVNDLMDEVHYNLTPEGGNELTLIKRGQGLHSGGISQMEISLNQVYGRVAITVMALNGDLDGSNFQDVIAKAKEVYDAGARHLLLDMSGVPFMSSAGLIALHSAALLMRGETPPNPEEGWAAFHAVSHDLDSGVQPNVKLLAPKPAVTRVLEKTGMNRFFEIHSDHDEAIASF